MDPLILDNCITTSYTHTQWRKSNLTPLANVLGILSKYIILVVSCQACRNGDFLVIWGKYIVLDDAVAKDILRYIITIARISFLLIIIFRGVKAPSLFGRTTLQQTVYK